MVPLMPQCIRGAIWYLPNPCPFVKKNGTFAALKGMKFAEEAEAAKKALSILGGGKAECVEVKLPYLEDKRAVIYIKKEKNTPKVYPRKAGTPDKNPL